MTEYKLEFGDNDTKEFNSLSEVNNFIWENKIECYTLIEKKPDYYEIANAIYEQLKEKEIQK